MAESQTYIPTTLPHDIIENILSRLPVKSLLRLKTVSKQWQSTISDSEFAHIHLQQSKKSSSTQNLFVSPARDLFHVVKIEDDNYFRKHAAIACPLEIGWKILKCHCDGLLLYVVNDKYVLWNASSRSYKKLRCPYPIHVNTTCLAFHGIWYDPLIKDYKVVIADLMHYAVFYCRKNYWTEMKEMKLFSHSCEGFIMGRSMVFLGESLYWLRVTCALEYEIVCFDCRDEKFRKLAKLNLEPGTDFYYLTSFGGHLSLFRGRICDRKNEMTIMKKDLNEDSWIELKVLMSIPCGFVHDPICLKNENEIILYGQQSGYIIYNQSKMIFTKLSGDSITECFDLVPYLENLFF